MSNPLNFVFDGEYRRRPEQNLGGRRLTDTRNEVVRRAQLERGRRERDRRMASSILVLQSYIRTFIVRKRLKEARRAEFDANKKETYSDAELGAQLSRLNYFHDLAKDNRRYIDTCKVMIGKRKFILQKCSEDPVWLFRLCGVLRNSLTYRQAHMYPVDVRLFEEFTSPPDFTEDTFQLLSKIWINMIIKSHFFSCWRNHMECKCVRPNPPDPYVMNPLATGYFDVLTRPLQLVSKLLISDCFFKVDKTILSGPDFASYILENFTESFMGDLIVSNHDGLKAPRIGIGTYLVLPNLHEGNFPLEEWCQFLSTKNIPTTMGCLREARSLLFALLYLSNHSFVWKNPFNFFCAVNNLLPGIDPGINARRTTPQMMETGEFDEDLMLDFEETEFVCEYYLPETQRIIPMLAPILNSSAIIDWLSQSEFDTKWNYIRRIISVITRLDQRKIIPEFTFLSVLAYKRDFMRALFVKAEGTRLMLGDGVENPEELYVFCFLFNLFMSTLHDAEFLIAMPMTKLQLTEFVISLRIMYADIINHGYHNLDDPYNFFSATAQVTAATLMLLFERNTRISLFEESTFLSQPLRMVSPVQTHSLEFQDFAKPRDAREHAQLTPADRKFLNILNQFPFCLSFHDRVSAWHRLLDLDRGQRYQHLALREQIQIRRTHIYEDAYEKLSVENVPDLRDNIRISLVNVVGAQEAGVDGGGLLREFLSEATRAGVDPNRGLFRLDLQNRVYPNPIAKSIYPKYKEHFFLMGRLVGKALYEQTLLELPLAAFFIQTCISGKIDCAVDYLAMLDAGLHKNLLALKTYSGDWNALGLDFTLTLDQLGTMTTVELKKDGASIAVDESNVIEYIHLVADYKINREMRSECRSFRAGLFNVVPILKMFSWREMQTLISGSDKAIDLDDWQKFTHYGSGYTENHPTIAMFWMAVRSFSEVHLRKLLKFVTSCSRPPILGFKDLVPNFGIQNAGASDRLPTAATCMNLLKLPEFTNLEVLRERLIYAIDAQAGFELS